VTLGGPGSRPTDPSRIDAGPVETPHFDGFLTHFMLEYVRPSDRAPATGQSGSTGLRDGPPGVQPFEMRGGLP
jgi:hypothetical protein